MLNRRWRAVGMMAVVSGCSPGTASAQDTPHTRAIWVQAGLGVSSANLGGLAAASVAMGRHLISSRASFIASDFEGGEEESFDVALLYGRQLGRGGSFRPSASAGVGYVKCEGCNAGRNASAVGLALSLEAALWPTKLAGIGIHGFGNLNSIGSFAGLALTVHFGRLR